MQAEGTENKTALTPNVAGDGNVSGPSDNHPGVTVVVFGDCHITGTVSSGAPVDSPSASDAGSADSQPPASIDTKPSTAENSSPVDQTQRGESTTSNDTEVDAGPSDAGSTITQESRGQSPSSTSALDTSRPDAGNSTLNGSDLQDAGEQKQSERAEDSIAADDKTYSPYSSRIKDLPDFQPFRGQFSRGGDMSAVKDAAGQSGDPKPLPSAKAKETKHKGQQDKRAIRVTPTSKVPVGNALDLPYFMPPFLYTADPRIFFPTPSLHDVMSKDQWVSQHFPAKVECKVACDKMLNKKGLKAEGSNPAQYVTVWDENKSLVAVQHSAEDLFGDSQAEYLMGLIDSELMLGNPVMVGVDVVHFGDPERNLKGDGNNNLATHHFVVIVGKVYDSSTGEVYYHFFDPASDNTNDGTSDMNRLYVSEDFITGHSIGWTDTFYIVTEVRRNQ